ncbi:MAG TPA: hypothetical protein VIO16_02720, partial [Dehalococcoidia bacterium]
MTDQHWFDALAVTLARGISRKQLLKLAGGAALSLMAPRLPALAQQARCRTGADCPAGTPDCCAGQTQLSPERSFGGEQLTTQTPFSQILPPAR